MKYKQLTSEQGYSIKVGLQAKMALAAIAKQIDVSVSTISREIKRNKNNSGGYTGFARNVSTILLVIEDKIFIFFLRSIYRVSGGFNGYYLLEQGLRCRDAL